MKTIIFDMHGVIMKDPRANFMPFINETFPHKTEEDVVPLWTEAGFGRFTSLELLMKVGFQGDVREIEKRYLDTLEIDEGFISCVECLRSAYRFALLSNDTSEWSLYIRNKFDLDRFFDAVVISGDVGLMKPDHAIYRLMLDKLRQPADECVFIDDRVRNLYSAAEVGIETICFNRSGTKYEGKNVTSFGELLEILSPKGLILC